MCAAAAAAAGGDAGVEGAGSEKTFEVKKWNAVALWSYDVKQEVCAICRNTFMEPCIECQTNGDKKSQSECTIATGVCGVCHMQQHTRSTALLLPPHAAVA